MKYYRYYISLLLMLLIIIIKLISDPIFNKVKSYLEKDTSLFKIGYNLINIDKNDQIVSSNTILTVNSYKINGKTMFIENIGNSVKFNLKGFVGYKDKTKIRIDVSSDIYYYIKMDNISVNLYERIMPNQIIGYSKEYEIYTNDINNFDYLKFELIYEEI